MSAVSKNPTPASRAARITRSLRSASVLPPKLLHPTPTMGTSIPDFPRLRRGNWLITSPCSAAPATTNPNTPRHRGGGTAGSPTRCYPRRMPDTAAPDEPAAVALKPVVVERQVVGVRTLVVAALIVIAILGLTVLMSQVVNLLLILLVAIVFAEGMRPLVNRLAEARLPRPMAITAVYIGFIAVLAVLITLLVQPIVSEATSLARNFPSYQASIQTTVTSWQHALNLGGSG